ncbi:MAG: hypothetical protein OEU93_12650, partial [Rubrivivax sp.]|nr:hypothetical protein [Rubrivivax sp.]
WAVGTPFLTDLWQRFAPSGVASARTWTGQLVDELMASGALAGRGGVICDAPGGAARPAPALTPRP